jgi:hypothetical protein
LKMKVKLKNLGWRGCQSQQPQLSINTGPKSETSPPDKIKCPLPHHFTAISSVPILAAWAPL